MSRGPSVSTLDVERVVSILTDYKFGLSRAALRGVLSATYRKMGDSVVRVAIENARASGALVITAGDGQDRVYKIARTADEYLDWERRELSARLNTMLHQRSAMRETVARSWPEQMRLVS